MPSFSDTRMLRYRALAHTWNLHGPHAQRRQASVCQCNARLWVEERRNTKASASQAAQPIVPRADLYRLCTLVHPAQPALISEDRRMPLRPCQPDSRVDGATRAACVTALDLRMQRLAQQCAEDVTAGRLTKLTCACSALPKRVPKTAKLGAISSYTGARREVRSEATPPRIVGRSHTIMKDSTMLTPACGSGNIRVTVQRGIRVALE